MIDLKLVTCDPPGSAGTALDIDLLKEPIKRFCGMCQRDVPNSKLHDICPHCQHRFDWFQLLGVGGLAASPKSEKALATYIKRYKQRIKRREEQFGNPLEYPDDEC